MNLSEAVEDFLAFRQTAGFRPNTLLINARSLRILVDEVGNIPMGTMDAAHGEAFQARLRRDGFKPNSVNAHLVTFSSFTKWARSHHLLQGASDPTANVRALRVMAEPRYQLDQQDFPAFLDVCASPHERIVVALGLYLFCRASEITAMRVKDVNLDAAEILVHVMKSQTVDTMPICQELDVELRRWLAWYTRDIQRALKPDWFLVPARRRRPLANDGSGPGGGYLVARDYNNCLPTQALQRPHRYVQAPLVDFGIALRSEDGKSTMEGVHTLRRSGARALFDQMVAEGSYDGVLRYVSAMLHHKSTVMTERYLGLDVDVKKRNDLLKFQAMFPGQQNVVASSDNVINIRRAK